MREATLKDLDIELADIGPILWTQRWVISGFVAFVVLTTMTLTALRAKEYRATAMVHLVPRTGQEFKVKEVMDLDRRGFYEIQLFYKTQVQVMQSGAVRTQVAERFNGLDAGAELSADDLETRIRVVPRESSQLIDLHVTHNDAEQAAILANILAEVYLEQNLDSRRETSRDATGWLEEKTAEYSGRVTQARADLVAYKAEHNLADVDQEVTTLSTSLKTLGEAYGRLRTQRVQLESTVGAQRRWLQRGEYEELAKVLNTDEIRALEVAFGAARAEDAELADRYGERWPERQRLERRMEQARERLEQEIEKVVVGQEARLALIRRDEERTAEEIALVKVEMLGVQSLASGYQERANEVAHAEEFLDKLMRRYDEVRLTARTQLNNAYILDRAVTPEEPITPNFQISFVVALALGVAGGIALALLRVHMDDTVSSQSDVVTYLKVPFLGLIPAIPSDTPAERRDLYTHLEPRSSVAEAVRGVRTVLEMRGEDGPRRRILVTSSLAREGKTSTAVRLGLAFAQTGKRVALIDADLRRPRLHKVFGRTNAVGLTSYLVGAADARAIAARTEVPNLDLIGAGPGTDHAGELLSKQEMGELLQQLEEIYDIIIVDTPPSAALSDAANLCRHMDAVVMVVQEHAVSRHVASQTIERLRSVSAPIVGVILNNVDISRGGANAKYYYAYRDYYYRYESKGAA